MTSISTFKSSVEKLIESKQDMDKITKYIKDAKVCDDTGRRISLGEKYVVVNLDRQSEREKVTLDYIKNMLTKLVETENLEVDKLGKDYHYDVYLKIKGAHIIENGKRLSMEEIFEKAGFPRKAKYKQNLRQALIDEIEDYKKGKDENCFHVPRTSLPFYPTLKTYKRSLSNKGVNMTTEQIMHDLGYKNYSDLYYRMLPVQELKTYRDERGYIDTYRKDDVLKGKIALCADYVNLPTALLILLVCDEKLKSCAVTTYDYLLFVKEEALKFLAKNDWSFVGIKTKNPNLYNKLRTLKKELISDNNLGIEDVIELMGLSEYEHNFKKRQPKEYDISEIIINLYNLSQEQDHKIYRKNIGDYEYRKLVEKAVKLNISVKDLFLKYDMEYVDGINISRLTTTYVEKYPLIDEMKIFRDQVVIKNGISLENGYTKEEVFEQKVLASKLAYDEYRSQIFKTNQDESE